MNETSTVAAPSPPVGHRRPELVVTSHAGLGILAFSGPDAATFLQGQLSSDVNSLVVGQLQWSSYNSPKGRMLATLCLWRAGPEEFLALLADDLAAPMAKRLQMFVMRAKVTLRNLSADTALLGIGGPAAEAAITAATGIAPVRGEVVVQGPTSLVGLPDGRVVVVTTQDPAGALVQALAEAAPATDDSAWQLLAIRAGVPQITAATLDLFVAQTANWEVVGGVNFGKGCYPGQEIVARMQYLGRLKERLARFSTPASPDELRPGTPLFGSAFADQPCGTVVNAAGTPDGDTELLAVVQLAALASPPLRVGAPDGAALTQLDLPYPLPVAAAPRPKL